MIWFINQSVSIIFFILNYYCINYLFTYIYCQFFSQSHLKQLIDEEIKKSRLHIEFSQSKFSSISKLLS